MVLTGWVVIVTKSVEMYGFHQEITLGKVGISRNNRKSYRRTQMRSMDGKHAFFHYFSLAHYLFI